MHIFLAWLVVFIFRERLPLFDNSLIFTIFTVYMLWEFLKWRCLLGCDKPCITENLSFEGPPGSGKTFNSVTSARRKRAKGIICYLLYKIFPFLRKGHPNWKYKPKIYANFPIVEKWIKTARSERKRQKAAYRTFKKGEYKLEKQRLRVERNDALRAWKAGKTKDEIEENINEFYKLKYKHWVKRMELKDKLYSLGVQRKKPVFCEVLTDKILLRYQFVEENAIFVVGEAGQLFPQWEFDNPLIMEQITDLNARGRHYRNILWIIDDQSLTNVAKPIRVRNGWTYYLSNFRRAWGFMPFYKCDYHAFLTMEGENQAPQQVVTQTNVVSEQKCTFWGRFPYSWQRYKRYYNSRYLKELYELPAVEHVEKFDGFTTRYVPNFAVSSNVERSYRANKRRYKRNYLYHRGFELDLETGLFVEKIPHGLSVVESQEVKNERHTDYGEQLSDGAGAPRKFTGDN